MDDNSTVGGIMKKSVMLPVHNSCNVLMSKHLYSATLK